MARPKRSDYTRPLPPAPAPLQAPSSIEPGNPNTERLRIGCPLCGLLSDVDRLEKGPHRTHRTLQRWGGEVWDAEKGRFKSRIEYHPETPDLAARQSHLVWMLELVRRVESNLLGQLKE